MADGFNLTIELEGEKVLSRRLLIVSDGLQDFEEPLRSIGTELHKTWQDNFDQRGGLFGGWPERKPRYKNGERIDTWPLMEKTGELRSNFKEDITKTNIVLYNDTSYFKYHQSKEPRTILPLRVMMAIEEDQNNMIVKAFQSYLIEITRLKNV